MRIHSSTRYAAFAALMGALACAGNKVETDETGAARDTTTVNDTTSSQTQNSRDTTIAPTGQTPSDTLLQHQGTGVTQDTGGYTGVERVDTTSQPGQQVAPPTQADTSSLGRDTTGMSGMQGDTSAMDSTGAAKTGDTTGYNPTQQSRDTTYR